ncbi:2-amino-4-hydroxy-6-hydroxymethyldihydropteridine diphosphokinase [Oceanobacter mangrovi]|uniref:2-amino-4-hydroxy-6- hydroxymethyldihydropteridine diphosphokinase n=1 Tax=Oceanobacter mangrovi TaxID=2862510 RepID=UPI001C8E75F8|nr:2-amino-4-hydroxy-6-hydroxymethyldihydropteridine diphosphokinase [Oceanobacter mangrovi]
MRFYLLGLGSNIDPASNLNKAMQLLQQQLQVLDCSPVIDTAAVGSCFNAAFKNQLILAACPLSPEHLKQQLLQMEERLGREPKTPERQFHDRPIDIDILAYADEPEPCLQTELSESYYQTALQRWQPQLALRSV